MQKRSELEIFSYMRVLSLKKAKNMYNTNSKEKYEFLQKKQKNWIFSFSRENIFQKLFF